MEDENQLNTELPKPVGFWKTRAGIILLAFLAIGGVLLAYEQRIHVFSGNGLLIGLLAACIVVHLFMHGSHGGHGGGADK